MTKIKATITMFAVLMAFSSMSFTSKLQLQGLLKLSVIVNSTSAPSSFNMKELRTVLKGEKQRWKDGTKITYENEGDEAPGVSPSDIIFVVKAKPHDRFERNGDNLICKVPITLQEALTGTTVKVAMLDGRGIDINVPKLESSGTTKLVPGEGMLNSKTQIKGDLVLHFIVKFPNITETERNQIGNILKGA